MTILHCQQCGRTGIEQLATCPKADMPGFVCPEPVAEDPERDVTIQCHACDFTRTLPLASLIKGNARNYVPACRRDVCAAKVLQPEDEELANTTLEVVAAFDAEIKAKDAEIASLKEDSEKLARLEAAGVDNWEGYSEAFTDEEEEEAPQKAPTKKRK